MKKQVVMSPSGDLAVAIPLYQLLDTENMASLPNYSVAIYEDKPIAYAIDIGEDRCPFISAEVVEAKLEFLGDL